MKSNGGWPKDVENCFKSKVQETSFKENDPDNCVKANYKRQSLHQILLASQNLLSNETTCNILEKKLRDYSMVVDKPSGTNNYAAGVLDLVPHNVNDTKKWTSSAKASELLQKFLKPLHGDCYHKGPEGCEAYKPSKTELETFLMNKMPFEDIQNHPPSKAKSTVSVATALTTGPCSSRMMTQTSLKPPESHSVFMKAIKSRVFGATKPQPKVQAGASFRTAGTELKLQNAKKYGQGQDGDCQAYGSGKRSLGGRTRTVNSKFVPPAKPDSQEDVNTCEEEDERLRLIDPKLVELIRSEIMDHGPPVTWDDIAGLHFVKTTIKEIVVLPMLRPDIFTGLRRPPKGILLFGPPGTGKTLIGKCIASQSKSTFFNISASSLTSKWVGEGEKMVRTLFTLARIHQPAVVFIDEIDSLLSQRSDSEHESSRRIKTEFLVQLDGAGTGEEDRILVIGATNRPQELDEAARRRLVKRLYIPLPDHEARCQIVLNLMLSEQNVLTKEQVTEIASLTEGFSGADMKTVCQEACLGPIRSLSFSEVQNIARHEVRPVAFQDFTAALSRVRSSVSAGDLETYVTWDKTYGSGGAPK